MLERVSRSTTLLRLFVVLSALILGGGGLVLGSLVASAIRDQAVEDREAALTAYVNGVLRRDLVEGDRLAQPRPPSEEVLADAWDAMTTERPYAAAVPVDQALEEIRSGSGSQFAPVVAEALLRVFERDPAESGAQPRHATV